MKMDLRPSASLFDERISVRVSGVPPFGKVKIATSMSFPWAKAVQYESNADFTADADGCLDLSKQMPDSGSYDFMDSMGPVLSMKRVKGDFKDALKNVSVDQSVFINVVAECGQERSSERVERRLMSAGLRSQRVTGEFVGELFYCESRHDKTVVFLGGSSNEDLCTILPPAALLASHGFNVLALSFFGEKGLNSALAEVPLEYFEKVFAWLQTSPITACDELYLYGALSARYSLWFLPPGIRSSRR
jgi:hypothetical protein